MINTQDKILEGNVSNSASEILSQLCEKTAHHQELTFEHLLGNLGNSTYGIGLLIFAIPSVLPLSAIPGIAAAFSCLTLFFALQLSVNRAAPWIPQWLRKKTVNSQHMNRFLTQAIIYLQRLEHIIKPRYFIFSTTLFKQCTGIMICALSLLLMLPIPFSNMLFGGLIAILALGLIERDGLVLGIGLLSSLIVIALYLQAFRFLSNILF